MQAVNSIYINISILICGIRINNQNSFSQVMEDYKRKYSEVSERLMERNRQYQKLQGLYDSLRLRHTVVGERDALPQPEHFDFRTGKDQRI